MADIRPINPPPARDLDVISRRHGATLVYVAIPKCATSTIKSCMFANTTIGKADMAKHPNIFTAVRHPVDRIVSAYHYGWAKKRIPFDEWWNHVKQNPSWDIHTQPAADIINAVPGKVRVFQLEQIHRWWLIMQERYPGILRPLGHSNKTEGEKVSPTAEQRREILMTYAEDFTIWLNADLDTAVGSVSRNDACYTDGGASTTREF